MVDEIEESTQKLAEVERHSAWAEMARQISHEIKNPLTPMRLNVQQLLRMWNDRKPEFDQYLKRFSELMLQQIDTLATVATEFRNFAMPQTYKPDQIDLIEVLNNVTEMFKSETYKITLNYDRSPMLVWSNASHLLRVFTNIVKNAQYAISANADGYIDIRVQEPDPDTVIVSVADNGCGIPVEIRNSIFNPNFTTKSSGMGLGLSICKNLVNADGGDIYFDTSLDVTTFFVKLRRAD
jgi:nitrogen fixation/metabolism regulation signal transduction histidine kinase